jgi:NADH dehydrogenase
MKRVVIVGVGFGGLETARNLAGQDLDVLVLDRRNFHLFQPLLYQVATAMLDQETYCTLDPCHGAQLEERSFRMAEVQSIDLAGKRVLTADEPIAYDYLVVAAGSVTNFFGNDVLQQHAFDLKQLHDAVALRNHILSVYERASVEPIPKCVSRC